MLVQERASAWKFRQSLRTAELKADRSATKDADGLTAYALAAEFSPENSEEGDGSDQRLCGQGAILLVLAQICPSCGKDVVLIAVASILLWEIVHGQGVLQLV